MNNQNRTGGIGIVCGFPFLDFKLICMYFIEKNDLQAITKQLLDYKVVFHPRISPDGTLDFSTYGPGYYTLHLDRNLFTNLLGIISGSIEAQNPISRVIGTIIFWAKSNAIRLNGGIALHEYANYNQDNTKTHAELSFFHQIDEQIDIVTWKDIALGQTNTVPQMICSYQPENHNFTDDSEHYLMNYAQMIQAAKLLLQPELTECERMIEFLLWNSKYTLFGQYNLIYLALMFSGKINRLYKKNEFEIESILKKCRNQAWDLTYLSLWSIHHWDDKPGEEIWLFATMDKSLKKIFSYTHDPSKNIFRDCFGRHDGNLLESKLKTIQDDRKKPIINKEKIRKIINAEKLILEKTIKTFKTNQ